MVGGLGVPPSPSKFRPVAPSPKPARSDAPSLTKAKSASHLSTMTTVATPSKGGFVHDSDYLNTLPDPRTPSPRPLRRTSVDGSPEQHPDLSNEVAMLSTKLINAINYQTNLDDSLQQTRLELEAARRRTAQLEEEAQTHKTQIASGALVRKPQVDSLKQELAESCKQRDVAEKSRKEMEVELETLTSALFEEANTMVAAARKENEATERKNAQLRAQLNDTELLLASQQEQLQDLKTVMEKMTSERDETDTLPHSSTAPSTPGADSSKISRMFDSFPFSPNGGQSFGDVAPDHPLRFSHLITPVMRNDVNAYVDFADLLKTSRAAAVPSHSRNSSGVSQLPSAASSSPSIPGSFSSGPSASPRENAFVSSAPPLKDHRFYKRCLVEDIEPTLRLDLAPGLSWLARRTVIGAITGGSLVVEPFIPQSRLLVNVYACALCGESRRTEAHARRHRFRTSEDENAQRHPLCEFCLGRVRATCDFLGFLRMVRDGLWRAATEEDVKGAWEESVRLREKMFWARLGGGVIPAATRSESPTGTQRRGDTSSVRKQSSESSISRRLGSDDLPLKPLRVPKLGQPHPSSRQGRPKPTLFSHDSHESVRASEGSETKDFAAPGNDEVDETPGTPTGNGTVHENAGVPGDAESSGSHTTTIEQVAADEDSKSNPTDSGGQHSENGTPATESEDRIPAADSTEEKGAATAPNEQALEEKEDDDPPTGEMPGSFDSA